jgi:glycolate oxidase
VSNKLPIDKLQKIVGKDNLVVDSERISVSPENSQAAAEVVKLAGTERFKILPFGRGTTLDSSKIRYDNTVILKSDRINRVVKVVPDDLYVIVQSGFPLQELNRHLESHNLFYPLAEGGYSGTIGGSVAADLAGKSGNRKTQTKDYVLALQMIDAFGQVLNVGARTFKSVTGYDLPRLFVGSRGTLGFISEITLRLVPTRKRKDFPDVHTESPKMIRTTQTNDPKVSLSSRIKESLDPAGIFVGFESFV